MENVKSFLARKDIVISADRYLIDAMAASIAWALHTPQLVLFIMVGVGAGANSLGGAGGIVRTVLPNGKEAWLDQRRRYEASVRLYLSSYILLMFRQCSQTSDNMYV